MATMAEEGTFGRAATRLGYTQIVGEPADRRPGAGPPGPQGPAGLPGPPGISSAQFEGTWAGTSPDDSYALVLSETVGPGSWVATATVGSLGPTSFDDEIYGPSCELRNQAGHRLGGTGAGINNNFEDVSLTVNGGLFVSSGANAISLWCAVISPDNNTQGNWLNAQMVTLKVGGFVEE